MTRYVICDIEATGLHEEKEPIEIALITLEENKVIDVYETLINPLDGISEFIQDLTSISARELKLAPKFYEVAEAIRMRLEGNVFVSHNTDFDLNLLKKKYREMGQELQLKNFCTLKVAQHEIPGLTNYNLDALCSFFHIKIKERHRAIGDARATLELFRELRELRMKIHPVERYLPQHEKLLKELPARAGLLKFKNIEKKIIRLEASLNMHKKARELLEVRPENRDLLVSTVELHFEVTGSGLIAEFRKLAFEPFRPHWTIDVVMNKEELEFRVFPHKKGRNALWYFSEYTEAQKKLRQLKEKLQGVKFAYREGGKSKEEILQHNTKVKLLMKDALFPNEHLVLVGEGRVLNEKSVVLVRHGHVWGYGYTLASENDVYAHPDAYITNRYARHVGADRLAMRYLRELKNRKAKNEGWRSLTDHVKIANIDGDQL